MQRDRRRKNLKVDAGWDQIQTWLRESFPQHDTVADDRTTPDDVYGGGASTPSNAECRGSAPM